MKYKDREPQKEDLIAYLLELIDFNIFTEINKIHRHIKKSSRESLIDKISKRMLELEFVQ